MARTKKPHYKTLKPSHRERILLEKERRLGFSEGSINGNRKGLEEGTKQGRTKATTGMVNKLKSYGFGHRLRYVFFKEDFINELQQ